MECGSFLSGYRSRKYAVQDALLVEILWATDRDVDVELVQAQGAKMLIDRKVKRD